MIQIEKALIPTINTIFWHIDSCNYKDQSPYEWFINQKHIPFDISSDAHGLYYKLYHQFLEELYQLYIKTNSEYYWFNQNGKLIGDKESQVTRYEISSNNIRINKHLLRDIKLEELLKNN